MENKLIHFQKSDDLLGDIQGIIEDARYQAYQAVNISLVQRNWLLGYRISQEELKGEGRAEYFTLTIQSPLKVTGQSCCFLET